MKYRRTIAVLLLISLLVCACPAAIATEETIPMHRLYNPNSGEHFYTGSVEERDNLSAVGWIYEGVAWHAPVNGGTPIHRVYNPNSGDHHYSGSQEEIDYLVSLGWIYEDIAFNSASNTVAPQYRMYNPNADLGSHHYTGSTSEVQDLVAAGWHYEGIGWYGAGPLSPNTYVLELEKEEITVAVGTEYTLGYTYTGDQPLVWSSSNTRIFDVSSDGVITAKQVGMGRVRVTDTNKNATCTVKVVDRLPDTPDGEFTFHTPENTSITLGETLQLDYTYTGDVSMLRWESTDTDVATVDNRGVVTALKGGGFTIRVYYGNTRLAILSLRVEDPGLVFYFHEPVVNMTVGEQRVLEYAYNGTSSIWWTHSMNGVIDLAENVVTALQPGESKVYASNGEKMISCQVIVEPPASGLGEFAFHHSLENCKLTVGEYLSLDYSFTGDRQYITMKSSDESIIMIDGSSETPIAYGVSPGEATVTAYYGSVELASITIPVYEVGPAERIVRSSNNGPWEIGMTGNDLEFIAFARAGDVKRPVTVTSSNTNVATVEEKTYYEDVYVVNFHQVGTTTITITSDDGMATDSFDMNIRAYVPQTVNSPETFVAAANYVIGMNGVEVYPSGSYLVLWLDDEDLTWRQARGQGETVAELAWIGRGRGDPMGAVTYEGIDPENGKHMFYLHR